MNKSESIQELAKALVKFQDGVSSIHKDGNNPFFKSKYASLDNIVNTIRPTLIENGLAISQFPTTNPSGENELLTILMHESGQWISASSKLSPVDNKPQSLGSATTYARRYGISAVLCLVTDSDDDGNQASGNVAASAKNKAIKAIPLTQQRKRLMQLFKETNIDPFKEGKELSDEVEKLTGYVFIPENYTVIISKLENLIK